jgi:hypothetical protein
MARFDDYCAKNDIKVLYLPLHSSYLLQPLDISCFSTVKSDYRKYIENSMRFGINHIEKEEFLSIYKDVCMAVLNENNIRSGFRAIGLVPYDPDEVLSRLYV